MRTSKHYEDYFIQYNNGRFVLNSPNISGILLEDLSVKLKTAIKWYKPEDSKVSYMAFVFSDLHGLKISPLLKERKQALSRIESYTYPGVEKMRGMEVVYSKTQLTKNELRRRSKLTVYLVNMDTGMTASTITIRTKGDVRKIESSYLSIDADDARAFYEAIQRIQNAKYSEFHL
ncbi:hypothetical protein J6X90_02875 [Candidatus Saccharibacteria bacterium]|nr:hypothetical protein [Candidatus Saccharibacteria bacterium]